MKMITSLVVAGVMTAGLFSGCGKTETTPPPAPAPAPTPIVAKPAPVPAPTPVPVPVPAVPAAPVVTAPQPASTMDVLGDVKVGVQKAYGLAKEGKYQDALALLADKAVAVKNNPEAMKLINDATTQIKKLMAEAAVKEAGSSATKAVGDFLSK